MQGGGASSSSSAAHKRKGDKPGLSEAEVAEIREAFNLFDTDGSGESALFSPSFWMDHFSI